MSDNRKNIKLPPAVFDELDADRDRPWPEYLRRLHRREQIHDRLDDLEARLPRKVAEEVRR